MTFEKLQDDESVTELGAISILENGVSSPTENAADLFQKGAGNEFGVPNNVFGNEMTAENGGSVFAGFVAYRPGRESSLRSFLKVSSIAFNLMFHWLSPLSLLVIMLGHILPKKLPQRRRELLMLLKI
jgi:hypothetical protein